MQKKDLYGYYAFGYNYHLLRSEGAMGRTGAEAIGVINRFIESLTELELQVTRKIAEGLITVSQQIKKDSIEKIDQVHANKIRDEIEKLDPALDAELQLKTAYILTKKRYSLESLLSKPEELLASGAYSSLTDTSKRDYQLACTQIALSQPTAAAFHLMRMLEEQVRVLYYSFKKTNRLDNPVWGQITRQLREKRAPKPSIKILDHLDSMRIHFRNPTQHPDTFYSIDEAQDLLNQTITAVNMIASELPIC